MTNRISRFDNTALLNWAISPSKDYEQRTKSYFTKRTHFYTSICAICEICGSVCFCKTNPNLLKSVPSAKSVVSKFLQNKPKII